MADYKLIKYDDDDIAVALALKAKDATNDSDGNPINDTYIKKPNGIAAGQVLKTTTTGGLEWGIAYTLPTASSNALGGIKLGYSQSGKNYAVQLNSNNQAYVNVPWTDTDTTYTLPAATSNALGGIKLGYSQSGKNYPVALDSSNKAYVNVPWTDTTYTLPTASSNALGGIQLGYSQNGKNYPVALDSSNKAYVNVPWTDNNTIYSAGAGISISNATISNSGVRSIAQDSSNGHQLKINTNGTTTTITIPDNNTTYSFSGGTNQFTVTPSGGTAQTINVTPSIANNITGSGANGYLAKFNGTNTITKGPQFGSSTTKYLREDGTWTTPPEYSEVVEISSSSHAITNSDSGHTLWTGYNLSINNSDRTFTLSYTNSQGCPVGTEIAILFHYGKKVIVQGGSGIRFMAPGEQNYITKFSISDRVGLVAIKRIYSDNNNTNGGDIWMVQGPISDIIPITNSPI